MKHLPRKRLGFAMSGYLFYSNVLQNKVRKEEIVDKCSALLSLQIGRIDPNLEYGIGSLHLLICSKHAMATNDIFL